MNITLAGIHMDTGDALRAHCTEKLSNLKKFFEHVVEIAVQTHDEKGTVYAVVDVHANGIKLHAVGEGRDAFLAVDDAEHKLARQLRKYKTRLLKHRQRREKTGEFLANLPAINFHHSTLDDDKLDDLPTDLAADLADFAPMIKQKEVRNLAPMSVDEAVMQMDLLHKPAFLFQNAQTGTLNVVYRDGNGGIQWISPA